MKRFSSFTIILSFICLALVGLALVPLLPVKLNPSRTLPGFAVYFSMPGASSRVVEMEATSKLESMLARIRGVRKLNSTSGNGYGSITVELDKHADVDVVRFEASTIIRQTWSQLPPGVSYPYIEMKSPDEGSSLPFISFTLNAPSSPALIQQYAEEYIKPRLAALQGVYKVDISGATPMEWRLEYDSEQLRRLGISVQEISRAIQLHYSKEFLGTHNIETHHGKEWVRLALMPVGKEGLFDPTSITVTTSDGKMIRLDELVSVSRMEEAPWRYYRINGLNSIYLSITAGETVNQLQLSNAIMKEMSALRVSLPSGYEVHTSYNATDYIHEELSKIYMRTGLTILILLVFVWLITRSLKNLFLIVCSLAVNMSIAVIFYYLFGLEIQLFSLAGITVSLNLVIDSTIVMTDHILHRRNLRAFMSVLAATLTTIGSLVIIFFLDEKIRLNLQDFAAVVIVNLGVSLFVSLFFVPAMIDKLRLQKKVRKRQITAKQHFGKDNFIANRITKLSLFCRRAPGGMLFTHRLRVKRIAVYFTRCYEAMIRFMIRWRVAACLLLVLGFGLPVFLLPERMEHEGEWAEFYNKTFGSANYKENIKPIVDKALGGALRLFIQKVYEGSYFNRNEEVVLSANANLPNGSTLEQMNTLMKKMEIYLSQFKEIKQFQTSVYNARRADIRIHFKKEYQRSGFPYTLKANMTGKAMQLGGGSWTIYGLQDQGFSNDVRENAGSYHIKMYGYNYDELYALAEKLKLQLLSHRRIKEVLINSDFSWWKDDYQEYYFKLDRERIAQEDIDVRSLFAAVQPIFGKDITVGAVVTENGSEKIKLSSRQSHQYDVWAMQFFPYGNSDNKHYKLSELAIVEKGQMPQEIAKESQQYRLCLQYEYIGSGEQGKKVQERDLEEFCKTLPMGYTAESENQSWGWGQKDNSQYLLLLVVIAIIFIMSSILFNSLRQPFAIIFIIPVSYIGVFLTFYWFHLNFDQGGFASFILLCGITVNASIYILNEYNNIRRRFPRLSPLHAYTKAWNGKIVPIFLTIISTILGFIPFMIGIDKEAFWFPLAAGTIGGLIMSFIGIFLYLPVFCLKRKEIRKNRI